jgi:hypothetical protein
MRYLLAMLVCIVYVGCGGLQNPLQSQSANYAFLTQICSNPTTAAIPQVALGCAALGIIPTPPPPVK